MIDERSAGLPVLRGLAPIKAIGHGRQVDLSTPGTATVLIFVGRETQAEAKPISEAIREAYIEASQVRVCNVADVRGIPRLMRKPVEMMMKSSYNDAVEGLKPGRAPEDYVLILPDWDGELFKALGIDDVKTSAAVAVVDSAGALAGVVRGPDAAAQAVALLAKAGTPVASQPS
ncbi:MAG: hypothetical protein HY873_09675 [Chloroflexi bacterium]|nr:hypothetical protein [Chloroflexota bacterium]